MEAKELSVSLEQAVVGFIHEEIFTIFKIPQEIVIDGGTWFISRLIKYLMDRYKKKHGVTSPHHLQSNAKIEGTNKILEFVITKTFRLHVKDWADKLPKDLLAYRTTWRTTTSCTQYELVYGKTVLLPIEIEM